MISGSHKKQKMKSTEIQFTGIVCADNTRDYSVRPCNISNAGISVCKVVFLYRRRFPLTFSGGGKSIHTGMHYDEGLPPYLNVKLIYPFV